jgi:hypothetical protein
MKRKNILRNNNNNTQKIKIISSRNIKMHEFLIYKSGLYTN